MVKVIRLRVIKREPDTQGERQTHRETDTNTHTGMQLGSPTHLIPFRDIKCN